MNTVLSWLAVAGAAVLLIAVAVAWFEHRRRMASRRNDSAWIETEINTGARASTADVDIRLDHPPGRHANPVALNEGEPEQAARQAALAAALSRMARPPTEPAQNDAWADTEPQVNPAPSEPAPGPARTAAR